MRRASYTAGEDNELSMVSIADVCPVSGTKATTETPSCPFAKKANIEAGTETQGGSCPIAVKGGLSFNIMKSGDREALPLSNIPRELSFSDLKDILRVCGVILKSEKTWDDVEFYPDKHFEYPFSEFDRVGDVYHEFQEKGILYMGYANDLSVSVIVPNLNAPHIVSNLPNFATVRSLKFHLRSTLADEPEESMKPSLLEQADQDSESWWFWRQSEPYKPVPDSFPLSSLSSGEKLVLEKQKNILPRFSLKVDAEWMLYIVVLVVIAVGLFAVWTLTGSSE